MWPRLTELLLGAWLVLTPVIFAGTERVDAFAPRDVGAGVAVIILSFLSFWRRAAWAHLVTAVVALALGLAGYFSGARPGPPAAQNEITIALALLLLAIIPNEATQPPRPWRLSDSPPPR